MYSEAGTRVEDIYNYCNAALTDWQFLFGVEERKESQNWRSTRHFVMKYTLCPLNIIYSHAWSSSDQSRKPRCCMNDGMIVGRLTDSRHFTLDTKLHTTLTHSCSSWCYLPREDFQCLFVCMPHSEPETHFSGVTGITIVAIT